VPELAAPGCFDVRDVMRGFRPQHIPPGATRLVRWSPALDGRDGRGLRIALLDGSAAFDHPDLVGAAIEHADFTGPTPARRRRRVTTRCTAPATC
jgi:hypothetical protein